MAGVTNRIPFEEAADMLRSARACVSFVVDGEPRVEPAVVRYEEGRYLVGIDGGLQGPAVSEATLVIDQGVLFFDLRAIYVRGTPSPVGDPVEAERVWFELEPTKVTCWDYGRLRVADGPD